MDSSGVPAATRALTRDRYSLDAFCFHKISFWATDMVKNNHQFFVLADCNPNSRYRGIFMLCSVADDVRGVVSNTIQSELSPVHVSHQ